MQMPNYRAASRELLAQASAEIAAGDSRQASEKAWGAAAQMVKAIAQQRGWRHDSHTLLFQTAIRLAEETRDAQITDLFHIAGSLHTNFYENWLPSRVGSGGDSLRWAILEQARTPDVIVPKGIGIGPVHPCKSMKKDRQ